MNRLVFLSFALLILVFACRNNKDQAINLEQKVSDHHNDLKQDEESYDQIFNALKQVMQNQEDAWNNGDIDGFMEGYWNSPNLTFISGSNITYGWQKTLDGYKERYPDKSAMGELFFEIFSMEPLADDACYMIGSFLLKRENDQPSGNFSLLWRLIDGKWVIVSDQTC